MIYVARTDIREPEVAYQQPPPQRLAAPVLNHELSVPFEAMEQIAKGNVYIDAGTGWLREPQIGR